MKCISIIQPFAQAIMTGTKEQGRKTVEIRSKPTTYRGPLLIHASGKRSSEHRLIAKYLGFSEQQYKELPRGVIIGTVELSDVIDYRIGPKTEEQKEYDALQAIEKRLDLLEERRFKCRTDPVNLHEYGTIWNQVRKLAPRRLQVDPPIVFKQTNVDRLTDLVRELRQEAYAPVRGALIERFVEDNPHHFNTYFADPRWRDGLPYSEERATRGLIRSGFELPIGYVFTHIKPFRKPITFTKGWLGIYDADVTLPKK